MAAFGMAVLMSLLAYCMVNPVRWDGLGIFGALALYFPLHLLAFTVAAAMLAFIARRCRARLAEWAFGFVMILTVAMALTPTVAVWRKARELNVSLSPGTYLANAAHMKIGRASCRERVYVLV